MREEPITRLRRAELLQLTGISATAYNALAKRQVLPFLVPRQANQSWGEFTDDNALELAIFMDLTKAGQPQARSAPIVRKFGLRVLDYARQRGAKPPPLIFGIVGFRDGDGDVDYHPVIGSAVAFDEALLAAAKAAAAPLGQISEVSLVNVTATVAAMKRRNVKLRNPSGFASLCKLVGVE